MNGEPRPIPIETRGPTAFSSNTGSSTASSCTSACSCGWLGSGSSRDELELSRSALALACQLSDEQYAVPSHPFTVELTTRSLKAAQRLLRTAADPRTHGGA